MKQKMMKSNSSQPVGSASAKNRQYHISPALELTVCSPFADYACLMLREETSVTDQPDFESTAKDLMEAYFKFLHELTNITYHGQVAAEDEERLRTLFEELLRVRARLG